MKLSRFLTDNVESILVEWEAFARTQTPGATGMTDLALRDHAAQILSTIAKDIDSAQSPAQRARKSKGLAPKADDAHSAAAIHGELRQLSGFSLDQLLAEYRALRATVLRLWLGHITSITTTTCDEMVRFNEAIDQAVAESALSFFDRGSRARDLFLAILGHDLRGPLSTMAVSGDVLTIPTMGTEQTLQIGARVKRSAATMTAMVNDLLEYSRTQLGTEIPVQVRLADLKSVCEAALEDAQAGHASCRFELDTSGDLTGEFDSDRMQQVFTNLLHNAAQYRIGDEPVTMLARGEEHMLLVRVGNHGPVISPAELQTIFDALVQLPQETGESVPAPTSMGLGLFIARQITQAHGGKISVESSASAGTVFTVRLPRSQAQRRPPSPLT